MGAIAASAVKIEIEALADVATSTEGQVEIQVEATAEAEVAATAEATFIDSYVQEELHPEHECLDVKTMNYRAMVVHPSIGPHMAV